MGAGSLASMKYHYSHCFFTYSVKRRAIFIAFLALIAVLARRDSLRGQCQMGSLSGAEHLSNGNAGVLR